VAEAVKRPPFLGTWVAVLVLAGLGAWIYFVESKREGEPGEKKKEKVFVLDKAKVEGLELSAAGQEDVRLVREKDSWRMAAPLTVAADGEAADGIVSTLEGLERDAVVAEAPPDLGEYGLATPRATVKVRVQGAPQPLALAIGNKTPDGGALYARLPPAPAVFTIPAYVESSLVKKPFDLRDRALLHLQRDQVASLAVTGPEGSYALAKDAAGEWAFTRPIRTRAGRWSVDALVGTLEGLRMEAIASESATDGKPFGLAPPARTVTISIAGGAPGPTLEIGSSPSEGQHHVRVAGSPLVAIVPGAVVNDLAKGMGELRAKRLLEVAAYDVEGFDVDTGGVHRVYARTTSKDEQGTEVHKWKRTAPEAKDVDTNKVQDALFAVGGLEVAEFVDAPQPLAAYGLDAPALKVSLRHAGGRPPAWFEIGTKDGACYGRREGDDAVMKLDAAKAAELITGFTGI
jgi:hypothetical protein